MEEKELFRCNVLITKEEYIEFYRLQQLENTESTATLLYVFAAVCVMAGVVLGTKLLGAGAVALGVLCFCLAAFLRPMLFRMQAAGLYEDQPQLRQSSRYVFYEDAVQIETARESGRLPLQNLTRWAKTERFLELTFSRQITLVLPLRLLTQQQIQILTDRLKAL